MIGKDTFIHGDPSSDNLLELRGLSVFYEQEGREKLLLNKICLQIKRGKFTALIGRSGIGKSLTMKSILGLLRERCWRLEGDVVFNKDGFICPTLKKICHHLEGDRKKYILRNGKYNWPVVAELRGENIFTIFQGPDSHLHPSLSIGWQIGEIIDSSQPMKDRSEIEKRLEDVGINPQELKKYSHQFSQGQKQRIMTAMALTETDLVIADEPTSALDSATKKEIIDLFKELRKQGKIKSMLLITHDLETVSNLLNNDDTIVIMDRKDSGEIGIVSELLKGEINEFSSYLTEEDKSIFELFEIPPDPRQPPLDSHPLLSTENYSWFREERPRKLIKRPILHIEGLQQGYRYGIFGKVRNVLKEINFEIDEGEIFGIVGESGCGKTTLVKSMVRLLDNTRGKIYFWPKNQPKPIDLIELQPNGLKTDSTKMRRVRRELQVIFQDSATIFNPRMTIRELFNETLDILGIENQDDRLRMMQETLSQMGICSDDGKLEEVLSKYPRELSGGERQRLAMARVFLLKPRLVIADEPFAEQDKITKIEILKIIDVMNREGATFIIISHDMSLVEGVCDRVAVMKDGGICEVINFTNEETGKEKWQLT